MKRYWIYAVLLLLVVAVFMSALGIENFVYDSKYVIAGNPRVNGAESFVDIWTSSYWGIDEPAGLYRPLTVTSFWFEYNWLGFGTNPLPFLVVNILLHALASILLFQLGCFWCNGDGAAFLVASLYTVHPLATAVVPNLIGRADLLAVVFLLGTLITWEKYRRREWFGWGLLASGLWLLGLLSKESVVLLPLVLVLRDWLLDDPETDSASVLARTAVSSYLPLVLLGSGWFLARTAVLGGIVGRVPVPVQNPLEYVSLAERLLTAMKVFGLYLLKVPAPFWLSADYSFNQISIVSGILDPWLLVGLAGLAGLVWLAYQTAGRKPEICLGVVLFLTGWLPVSNLPVTIGSIKADRFLYLPLIGLCLVVGSLAMSLYRNSSLLTPVVFLCLWGTVLGGYAARTLARNPVWYSDLSLWKNTVRVAPESVVANSQYSLKLLASRGGENIVDIASRHARKAVKLAEQFHGPTPVQPYHSYARTAIVRSQLPSTGETRKREILTEALSALAAAREALEADKKQGYRFREGGPRAKKIWNLYHDIGSISLELKRYDPAERALERAFELDPKPADLALLGKIKLEQGLPGEASGYLKRALRDDPDNTRIREWLQEANRRLED